MLVSIVRLLFGLCGLLAVWLGLAAPAGADVSPTGAFQTSVAIKVPPFHGLEPRLGLSYSSSTPNGWLGAGWSLTGLSTIRRQSSDLGLPRWDASDMFAVDGQRLLVCPSKVPKDQGALARSPSCAYRLPPLLAYTTRVESFQRIAAEGDPYAVPTVTSNPQAGDDPDGARWLVWRTDGVKATYEPGLVTSRGVLEWRLTQVEDLNLHKVGKDELVGNVVNYDWADPQDVPASVLETIRYGDVEIRFQRQPRPDRLTIATGAGIVQNGTRLQAIEEFHGEKLIRGYALTYRPDDPNRPHRQSFLESVQQYGSDGIEGDKLPATGFTSHQETMGEWAPRMPATVPDWAADWPAGPDDSSRFAATLNGGAQGSVPWPDFNEVSFNWLSADLNGDRRSDFILIKPDRLFYFDVQIELTQPDGGYQHVSTLLRTAGVLHSKMRYYPFVSDINGDGLDDLTVAYSSTFGWELSSVVGRSDWSGSPDERLFFAGIVANSQGVVAENWLMGDVTGDGFADLIALIGKTKDCWIGVRVGIGAGNGAYFDFRNTKTACWSPRPQPSDFGFDQFGLTDINGDLVADVVGFLPAVRLPEYNRPHALGFTAVSDGTEGFLSAYVLDTGEGGCPARRGTSAAVNG